MIGEIVETEQEQAQEEEHEQGIYIEHVCTIMSCFLTRKNHTM